MARNPAKSHRLVLVVRDEHHFAFFSNVQINTAYLNKAFNDAGPRGCSTAAVLEAEQMCMKSMPTMVTEMLD